MKIFKNNFGKLLLLLFLVTAYDCFPDIIRGKNGKPLGPIVQRASQGFFDNQENTISNIEFFISNYGILFQNIANNLGGGYWPRNSRNQYIWAGGIWFSAEKTIYLNPEQTQFEIRRYVSLGYNTSTGSSWYTPGRVEDLPANIADTKKYRVYFSSDFNQVTGKPQNPDDGDNWPVWDSSTNPEDTLKNRRYFGRYIQDSDKRNRETYAKGPAYISGEDIFTTYHDMDLSRYELGAGPAKLRGYPLGIQHETTIYSWGFGAYKDFIFVRYDIINKSPDTLRNCWLAPIMDVDIARYPFVQQGASNDRVLYYDICTAGIDTVNMAFQWSNTDEGEAGFGFGYLGFDFLESPSVYPPTYVIDSEGDTTDVILHDSVNFVRRDSAFYHVTNQLGLRTFRNWSSSEDKTTDEERFQFLAYGQKDGDTGPGDKRFMMATGPFNMRPDDTSRTVVSIQIAEGAKGSEPDGTCEDLLQLKAKNSFAQQVYDDNFRAPQPPYTPIVTDWFPQNHGITIRWDSTSEMSYDDIERGLHFMGYRVYRSRRPELDTFSTNEITESDQYPNGANRYGWKRIAEFNLPTLAYKSAMGVNYIGDEVVADIDSLRIVGPYTDKSGNIIDTMALRVMRVGRGIRLANNPTPVILGIDTSFSRPWGNYFYSLLTPAEIAAMENPTMGLRYDNQSHEIFDTALVGIMQFNRSSIPYNPLYFRRKTIQTSASYIAGLGNNFPANPALHIVYEKFTKDTTIGNPPVTITDTLESSTVDSVYFLNTLKNADLGGGQTATVIDVLVPRPVEAALLDSAHVKMTLDSLYSFIANYQGGVIIKDMPDPESSFKVRSEYISPYMELITGNRTVTDIGDDDRDGYIQYLDDPSQSEKLINNVSYFYKVEAIDEGDYSQPTGPKRTPGTRTTANVVETYPMASRVGDPVKFEIIHVDSALMGGLHNFNFFAIDEDRVLQNYEGDTLELEFNPEWSYNNEMDYKDAITKQAAKESFALYARNITLRNISKDSALMYSDFSLMERTPCNTNFSEILSENSFIYTMTKNIKLDSIVDPITRETIGYTSNDLGTETSSQVLDMNGVYSTGDFETPRYCKSQNMFAPAYGALGFSFEFDLRQYGGVLRADTAYVLDADASTRPRVAASLTSKADRAQYIDSVVFTPGGFESLVAGSFNNGSGDYMVEFLPGGTEEIEVKWGGETFPNKKKFTVNYLNVKVTDVTAYNFVNEKGDSMSVKHPAELELIEIGPAPERILNPVLGAAAAESLKTIPAKPYPSPVNLTYYDREPDEFIGKYTLAPFGWVNGRTANSITLKTRKAIPADVMQDQLGNNIDAFIGRQGRYYVSGAVNGTDTLDFSHVLNIGGTSFGFDYINKGRGPEIITNWWNPLYVEGSSSITQYYGGPDFQPGDKVMLKSRGGVRGLPFPAAKVRAVVKGGTPEGANYTDDLMEQIRVVPNPYYISHQGQGSPYDAKIYFTKLPEKCTIDIYTVTGERIITINHDEATAEETAKESLDVWNLLTESGQRVQSQTLIAHIKAANGAETMKKFTVVVGSFRTIDQ